MSDMPRVMHATPEFYTRTSGKWVGEHVASIGSYEGLTSYTRTDLVDELIKLVEDTFESESDFIPEWDLSCKAAIAAIQGEGK